MSKYTLLLGAALALFLLAAFARPAHAARQDGMVVVRDAQTGKLRAPTPDEAKALAARAPAAGLAPARDPGASLRRDGARGVRLGERTMVYDVVTRGADGRLSSRCVHGEEAAADALAPSTAPANAHEEHDHETR
jgi:hypothetical protein